MMDISKVSAMAVVGTRMILSSLPHRQQRFSTWKITSMVSLGKLFKNFLIGTCGMCPKKKMMTCWARQRMNCHTKMTSKKILVFFLKGENTSFQVADLERASINEQSSNNEDGISVQASLVDQIRRERELEVEENGFEDDADETLRQYDSEKLKMKGQSMMMVNIVILSKIFVYG